MCFSPSAPYTTKLQTNWSNNFDSFGIFINRLPNVNYDEIIRKVPEHFFFTIDFCITIMSTNCATRSGNQKISELLIPSNCICLCRCYSYIYTILFSTYVAIGKCSRSSEPIKLTKYYILLAICFILRLLMTGDKLVKGIVSLVRICNSCKDLFKAKIYWNKIPRLNMKKCWNPHLTFILKNKFVFFKTISITSHQNRI